MLANSLILLYFCCLYDVFIQHKAKHKMRAIGIVVMVVADVLLLSGIAFKVMHWSGGIQLLLFGALLLLISGIILLKNKLDTKGK